MRCPGSASRRSSTRLFRSTSPCGSTPSLEVGQQTEVVEVTGQAANVETVNQTVGTSIVGETIQRAPLDGRDVLDLAKLLPGVTETNDDSGAAGNYSIAGGRSDSVTFLLDGALNNNLLDNSVVYNPNPDTIAEFRLLESNYSAEYGRNGGGVISVVTKSGTNCVARQRLRISPQ